MLTLLIVVGVSYLVGGIPWSWLAVRLARGVDLRTVGSGNLGATNSYRALGAPGAIAVLALDALKGWVAPAVFAQWRIDTPPCSDAAMPALAGLAAITGHIFPIYLRFRGGKGIATTAGVFLALEPRALAISFAAFLVGVLATRGIISVGSLSAALALPIGVFVLHARDHRPAWDHVALATGLAILLWIKHASNLRRLVRGEEKRLFARGAAT